MTIKARVTVHNWTSDHRRDLAERLELMDVLKTMPLNELAAVVEDLSEPQKIAAIHFIQKVILKQELGQ